MLRYDTTVLIALLKQISVVHGIINQEHSESKMTRHDKISAWLGLLSFSLRTFEHVGISVVGKLSVKDRVTQEKKPKKIDQLNGFQ